MIAQLTDTSVKLKRIYIESKLPEALSPLQELSQNLWWSWDMEAKALFEQIAGDSWAEMEYNPIDLLTNLSQEQAESLISDKVFMKRVTDTHKRFKKYMQADFSKPARIAYFSMEFGLHISVKIYSGGLGVLAGDYLKEASDQRVNMVGVGLLYRYGYFQQGISAQGDQINHYPAQKFTSLPMEPVKGENGEWIKVQVDFPGRPVFIKVWKMMVGRIPLYLLDADIPENAWEDRSITHQLYGGDTEHRLKQEIVLGIGGAKALKAIGLTSDVYHCNEGHAAFLTLERIRQYTAQHHLGFDQAAEVIRATSIFTTHTPVPAGHDYFNEAMLKHYLGGYIFSLGISWERFIALGRIHATNAEELFSMSHLAMRLSQEVNGVSELHGAVSRDMFVELYPGYIAEELHISYVTNGVHYPTWVAPEMHTLYEKYASKDFIANQSSLKHWEGIQQIPDAELYAVRNKLKKDLLDYVKETIKSDYTKRGESPSTIFDTIERINENAIIIGFARRFATYKRAALLFSNVERLTRLISKENQPILFIFAGKAHPADKGGQDLIRQIIGISKQPAFLGKVLFLENYNMEMAKLLVQGVDIWMNTPTRPKEASGTSGMKAAINGTVNLSVLDGWWAEGYRPDAGWALPLENTYDDASLQNELDAATIYNLLETEILPAYFEKNSDGVSPRWMAYVKNIIAKVGPVFTMKRQLDDYFDRFYNKLYERGNLLKEDNLKIANELADWKLRVERHWNEIQVINADLFDSENHALKTGDSFHAKLTLGLGSVAASSVGIELVFFKRLNEDKLQLVRTYTLELAESSQGRATFHCKVDPQLTGVYEYGFRMYPNHPHLPHRQDMNLVRWL